MTTPQFLSDPRTSKAQAFAATNAASASNTPVKGGSRIILAPGRVLSITPRAPMALRIAEGQAWVTLDDGPYGARGEAAGDVFLQAGQTLWVATGQHAVVEPVGRRPLVYRLTGLEATTSPTTGWRRLLRGPAPVSTMQPEVCCA